MIAGHWSFSGSSALLGATLIAVAGCGSGDSTASAGASELLPMTGASETAAATAAPAPNGQTPDVSEASPPVVLAPGTTPEGAAPGAMPAAQDPPQCRFSLSNSRVSPVIPTVGIVEWSSDLAGIDSAAIEFGLDDTYGLKAPVDLGAPNHRTLLLGMKASREYHFRIVAGNGTSECRSEDFSLRTGPLANNLPDIEVTTNDAAALAGGYLVTGQYQGGPAYILDADGDFVWWYNLDEVTRARLSYDGKSMWIGNGNVPQRQAIVHLVSMDGLDDQDLSASFQDYNHDLAVLPDGTVLFIAYADGCDDIRERSPSGSVRTIINSGDVVGARMCHCNAIHYSTPDDTVVFSDLDSDTYSKVTRSGDVVWVLGGDSSRFTGNGATWDNQHGFQMLGLDRLLIFNNGAAGDRAGSLAIEILLNLNSMTATRGFQYAAQPAIANQVMGDVQRLDNGNTLVAYSTQGVVHEVDANGRLLQQLEWGLGGAIGYVEKRKSLYGPPPS